MPATSLSSGLTDCVETAGGGALGTAIGTAARPLELELVAFVAGGVTSSSAAARSVPVASLLTTGSTPPTVKDEPCSCGRTVAAILQGRLADLRPSGTSSVEAIRLLRDLDTSEGDDDMAVVAYDSSFITTNLQLAEILHGPPTYHAHA